MKYIALSLLSLSLASTFSMPTYAIEGGTALSWEDHPYLIESGCTGTVLAGKYVLLAGHCFDSQWLVNRRINFSNGNVMNGVSMVSPHDAVNDVALWTLPSTAPMDKALFVADLTAPLTTVKLGDTISFVGFGQDDNTPRLGLATNLVTRKSSANARFDYAGVSAHSVQGDSGAPVFNTNDKIIGINTVGNDGSLTPSGEIISGGVELRPVKDWLLQNINHWHSATELKFTGDTTIEVQSLHVNDIDMAPRQNNGTLTTGDVTVTGGTCVTDGAVSPFGMCTLELKSGSGEGKVILEDGNEITVNRAPAPKPEAKPDNGGSGGGSFGLFALLGLAGIALGRQRKAK